MYLVMGRRPEDGWETVIAVASTVQRAGELRDLAARDNSDLRIRIEWWGLNVLGPGRVVVEENAPYLVEQS